MREGPPQECAAGETGSVLFPVQAFTFNSNQSSGAGLCPAAAAPLQAHTPQTWGARHPKPAPTRPSSPRLRTSLSFSPGGLGLPEQRHGGVSPGARNRPGHGRLPLCRAAGAPFPLPSGSRPLPAALPPSGAARSGEQLSSGVPWGSGTAWQRRKAASSPLDPHLHPAFHIHTRTPRPQPGRCGAAPRERSCGGRGGSRGGSTGSRQNAPHCLAPGRAQRRRRSGGRGLLAGAGAVTGLGR